MDGFLFYKTMPGASQGFRTALLTMVGGIIISVIINGMDEQIPNIHTWKAIFDLFAVLGVITTLENANYWGIMYTLGYFMGIAFLGKHLLQTWEMWLILLVLGAYLLLKIIRKF